MAQLVTRINEDLALLIDELVAEGVVESRSDAVRRGLRALIDAPDRQRTAEVIVQGYERLPQTDQEMQWADQATVAMIAEDPW